MTRALVGPCFDSCSCVAAYKHEALNARTWPTKKLQWFIVSKGPAANARIALRLRLASSTRLAFLLWHVRSAINRATPAFLLKKIARLVFSNAWFAFQDQNARSMFSIPKLYLVSSTRVALWCGDPNLFKSAHNSCKAFLQRTSSLD